MDLLDAPPVAAIGAGAGPLARAGRGLVRFARATWSIRTFFELIFVFIGAPLAAVGFGITIVPLAVGLALAITFVGIPLLALGGELALGIGGLQRNLANRLLDLHLAPPVRPAHSPGFFAWVGAALTDPNAWKARFYLLIKLPLAFGSAYAAAIVWGSGIFWTTYPMWWAVSDHGRHVFGPADHQTTNRGLTVSFGSFRFDSWPRALLLCLFGVLLLTVAPWIVRALVGIDRWLIRGLLSRRRTDERVQELEEARTQVVDESAARLRRIERDLHDGAQAQLVTLAMQLGRAREKLDGAGDDPDVAGARQLVASAHDNAKQALVELRDLARGIHPPALDVGLDNALATLAARNALPTSLRADLDERPTPATEAIAYFSVAELLTNAAKHSGAAHAWVEARSAGGRLVLRVSDDGRGGAAAGRGGGTGLSGLVERVRAVDGTISVLSPLGGPTVVTIELPTRGTVMA